MYDIMKSNNYINQNIKNSNNYYIFFSHFYLHNQVLLIFQFVHVLTYSCCLWHTSFVNF